MHIHGSSCFKSHPRRLGNVQLIPYPRGLQQNKRWEWESNLFPYVFLLKHKMDVKRRKNMSTDILKYLLAYFSALFLIICICSRIEFTFWYLSMFLDIEFLTNKWKKHMTYHGSVSISKFSLLQDHVVDLLTTIDACQAFLDIVSFFFSFFFDQKFNFIFLNFFSSFFFFYVSLFQS